MSKISTYIVSIGALFIATAAQSQTYPSTYSTIPISIPGNNQPILATDFVFGARLQSFGTPSNPSYSIADYGVVPIDQFAFSADVQKTRQQVAAALGGGSSVDAAGQLTAPNYAIQGANYTNVGSALSAVDSSLGSMSARVNALQQFAYDARREARQGIAAAMAMTAASMPSAPGRTSWVVNASEFHTETAFGGAFSHRFDVRVPLAITGGFSVSGSGETGGRVGLAGEF
jgi:hypothetical protein